MQFLYEQNIIIYTFGALCGLGCILRLIISRAYKGLIKESDNVGATNNKQLKHMKLKFETCYKLKIGVNNVDTFVDKNVLRYKSGGILLSTWETIGGQILYLCLLLVPILALFGVVTKCGQDQILLNGSVGILASAVLIFVDKGLDLPVKKKMVRMNLMDYLENFCKVRLEQEVFHPELLEQYRNEYFKQTGINVTEGQKGVKGKDEPKDELNRRREARRRKEEEKRALALKREEEQKRIEELRKEEERKRIEERKLLAAKRREEERLRLEEERLALEARRLESKRKAEEKQQTIELKRKKGEEKQQVIELKRQKKEESILEDKSHEQVEELDKPSDELYENNYPEELLTEQQEIRQVVEEVAAEIEHEEKPQKKDATPTTVHKSKGISISEEKLIEDILKEFFA